MDINNIDRAIHELKMGRAININNVGVLHPEFANLTQTRKLKNPKLIITSIRAKVIAGKDFKYNAQINISNLSINEIYNLLERKPKKVQISSYPKFAAIELTKIAQILPCVIIFDKPPKEAIKISSSLITKYQNKIDNSLKLVTKAPLKLKHCSSAQIMAFRSQYGAAEHYAIIIGKIIPSTMVRIHSSCYTGDLLGSLTCDCGDQLQEALKLMDKNGSGILIYLMQEGRGIGLINKLRAYNLQAMNLDTVEANEFLGFDDEERGFLPAVKILKQLKVKQVQLISNNPKKSIALKKAGIKVARTLPLVIKHQYNKAYLSIKAKKSGHIID